MKVWEFDGDEMNLHLPQSVEAAIELMEIAAVPKQLISPRLSKPLVTVVQDTLVGVNRLTRPTEFFTRREFMNLLVHSRRWDGRVPPPAKTDPVPLWSGLQVVSALLPAVHLAMGNKMWDEAKGKADPNYVVINNGTIESGILDGDVFDKALVHILYNDFSPEVTVDFLDSLQAVVATYLQNSGFSVGLSDLIADSGTLGEIATNIHQLKNKIESLQLQVHMGLFDNTSGRTNQDEFESKVFNILNEVIGAAGKTGLKSLAANNRMVNMVKCGSKGSDLNIAQMIAVLGQQSIEGKRIAYGFQDRTLPHFKRYEDGADSRGFIESSFVKGLSPAEFFFHAMTGREGLIDTAVKSVTGDTEIRIVENGVQRIVRIGDWIDAQLANGVDEYYPNEARLEIKNLHNPTWIHTCDSHGIISAANITAITRHDPGDTLYAITTAAGRTVIVTAAKSLIVWDKTTRTYDEIKTTDVVVGDILPAIGELSDNIVQMDPIASIETIDVRPGTPGYTKYPKMYDLTVPSTLNFAIANGLVVRDTADSGYIQRQLVKTMEDLTVFYDGSVRDSGGLVVQFAYGDDGTSATKIENQPIGLAKMSDTEVRAKFTVQGVSADRSQKHLARVFEDRDMLVNNVWGGRADKMVQSAVHLPRLIANAIQQLGLTPASAQGQPVGAGVPVTSDHVLDTIDSILQRTRPDNRLWAALLRFHLNPADLQRQGFTRAAFDWLSEQIVVKHMKSWVVPGEMAGIIAAQSLGEPTTQMTVHKNTHVSIAIVKKYATGENTIELFAGKVGTLVDEIMTQNEDDLINFPIQPENNSHVLNAPKDTEYFIVGVSNSEKASWLPIRQFSRHPANGEMVRVKTKSGRSTTATLSHSFLKRTTSGIAEIKGSDLRIGHRIPVASRLPESPVALTSFRGYALTKDFGWLVGIYLADGSLNGNTVKITKIHPVVEKKIRELATVYDWKITVRNYKGAYGPGKDTNIHSKELKDVLMELCNTGSFDKVINAPIHHANRAFIAGVLSGYFDGDGNVNVTRQQIRVGSRSEELIRGIGRLLAFCGVFGTICQEKSIRMPGMVMHTLNVIRKHAARFQSEIGLSLPEKAAALEQIVAYNNREDAHSQKEDIDKIPELGDIIAQTGKLLKMPGQSRTYGRWASSKGKDSIGRRTLELYVKDFKEMMAVHMDKSVENQVKLNMSILESALNSDVIWDEIVELEILPDPHELVYDFTVPGNDSFMVDDNIFVHNTLNSVDWDTEILIAKNGKILAPRIGEFIDNYIESCDKSRIQHMPNDQLYVALDDGHDWKAVSCDENGKMMWTKLEAITKHPVVNDDGTNTILEVELESGRKVKATKGLSFLTLRNNKIVDMKGSDLVVGDVLPIANTLAIQDLGLIKEIELSTVLSTKEYLFGTEAMKALDAMKAADVAGNRRWFSNANGKDFHIPYSRSDAFRDAFTNGKNMHADAIKAGFVYPKKMWKTLSQIPDTIPLDREFGFFVGAFLSEGSTSPTQIQITNNDDTFLAPIRTLLDKWSIGHHTVSVDKEIAKTGIKGHTQSLIIHSTVLTAAMKAMFGHISYEKTIPDWVLQAPDDFVKGLVDGYISGDGSVTKQRTITASSVSENLMNRLSSLFIRFGIFTTMSSYLPHIRKFNSVSRCYQLYVPVKYAYVFATTFTLTIAYKQERLEAIKLLNIDSVCRKTTFADMVLDRVKSIHDTLPKGGKMYDITVEKTRNFSLLSGLAVKDTFHLAGVAAKSGMTRGVPRLKELLKVTQNPRATSLTIFLRPDIRNSKEDARRVTQELEFTTLKDLVTVSRIYYDPHDADTVVTQDKQWLAFYTAFEQSEADQSSHSPWILRLELDRERMFNKNINMEDINFVLRNNFESELYTTYTDHNASQLIFRIRIRFKQDSLDDLNAIKQFQYKILTSVVVRGLPGLRSVSFRKITDEYYEKNPANDNKFEPVEQFALDTLGTNFLDVLIHPDVDGFRLLSNHVHDINENLGIEAARAILFKEIFSLFESAAPVNYRHVAILCDSITNRGRLMSADRIGVNKKQKTGPLAKASFEQTEDIMLRAALFGELDAVTGVSANIMTGQPIRGGTSFAHVLLDEERMMEYIAEAPESVIERAPKIAQDTIDNLIQEEEEGGCRQSDLRIPVALPPAPAPGGPEELPELEIVLIDA